MTRVITKRWDYIRIIAALLFFLELQPYFMWGFTGTPMLLGVTLPLVLILVHHTNNKNLPTAMIFALLTLFDALMAGASFFGCISAVLVAVLFVCPNYLDDIYECFHLLYSVLIGFSSIIWVMVMLGVSLPYNVLPPLNSLKDYDYAQYLLLVMPRGIIDISLFRSLQFCGPFDEPGVVGTIAFLILLIERFNMRKFTNIIVFISGVISISLFFYVGVFLYMLYSITLKKGSVKIKIISLLLFIVLAILSYNFEVTNAAIWDRLEYDESKGIAGNNRADDDLKLYIKQIRGTEKYWFGVHDKAIVDRFTNSASVQTALLKYGFMGCAVYALFFVFYALNIIPRRKDACFCLFFLFLTLWQRPALFNIPYVFMYIVLIHNFDKQQLIAQGEDEKVSCSY